MFTLLCSLWDPYKLCWKKKIVFLLKIFYFSLICCIGLKTNSLMSVLKFICRQVGIDKLNCQWLDHNLSGQQTFLCGMAKVCYSWMFDSLNRFINSTFSSSLRSFSAVRFKHFPHAFHSLVSLCSSYLCWLLATE